MSKTIELAGGICVTQYWDGDQLRFEVQARRGFTVVESVLVIEALLKLHNEKLPKSKHWVLTTRRKKKGERNGRDD